VTTQEKPEPPKRGDVQVDPDGSRWIVVGVGWDGPRPVVSRVRETGLAAEVIFGAPSVPT
jgi:hypothetical protein